MLCGLQVGFVGTFGSIVAQCKRKLMMSAGSALAAVPFPQCRPQDVAQGKQYKLHLLSNMQPGRRSALDTYKHSCNFFPPSVLNGLTRVSMVNCMCIMQCGFRATICFVFHRWSAGAHIFPFYFKVPAF